LQKEVLEAIKKYLKEYDGPELRIMEVCGSHTGAIAKYGIPQLLSDRIHLISGPGCPVCVAPSSYIDRMIELSLRPDVVVTTFGDLLRVPGSRESLSEAKGRGAKAKMVYSPFDTIDLAKKDPDHTYIFAALGFETTAPVYALMAKQVLEDKIPNVKLLTAIKTMPRVIETLMDSGAPINAFLAPGHVSVVTGSRIWKPLADKYGIPFSVAGFKGTEILEALYGIAKWTKSQADRKEAAKEQETQADRKEAAKKQETQADRKEAAKEQETQADRKEAVKKQEIQTEVPSQPFHPGSRVMNFYPSVVREDGNVDARSLVSEVFEPVSAVWRGIGEIDGSGLALKGRYQFLDAGSRDLREDIQKNRACRCGEVLSGKIPPTACPLHGKVCTPLTPQGACMVSPEGNCRTWFENGRRK